MGSFKAHANCRPLRSSEIEYLQSIVHKDDDEMHVSLQGMLFGGLVSSIFWMSLATWIIFDTSGQHRGHVT